VVARVKGAPARLVELSDQVLTRDGEAALDRRRRLEILDANRALAGDGLRILGLARKTLEAGEDPGEDAVCGLTFLGLVAISDPPAPGVAETIAVLHGAGVRTVMLTGDQRATAESVARALGILREGDEVVEGRQLTSSGADELASRVDRTGAFCRVGPEHKLHIVEAFQQRGEIVAMLGDGVNDAPALERADIGVAMGGRGTDVAKEAADLVLADDRFQTIAAALQEGRVILDNIRKFIFYLFSCNLSEVLVLLLSVVAGLPLPLLPLQILWLNMVTDVFPALALGMEPAEPDVMRRPPRDPQAEILSRRFLVEVAAYGLLLTAVTLGAFLWADRGRGLELDRARTVAFMTLALTQLFHVFNARSRRPVLFGRRLLGNRWVLAAFALTVALQLAVVYLPPLSGLFQTVPLTAADWLLVLPAAVAPLVFGQLAKARRP
jgi:Ca2+-transporting ATPase